MSGYIKLHRSIVENPMWGKEPFSAGQAWVDLLVSANFKDTSIYIRKTKINLTRGQIAWSTITMSKRWKWSRGKVLRFLSELKTEGMIVQEAGHLTTITTICNYSRFQDSNTADSTANDTTGGTADSTTGGTQYKKVKNVKNEKKERNTKKETPLPTDFEITETMKTWFAKQGFTIDLDQSTDRWQDAMIAKGRTYTDWSAAWRNGMKLAQGWHDQRRENIQPVQGRSNQQPASGRKMFPGINHAAPPTGTGGDL